MYKSLHTCCKSLKYDVVKSLSSTHQGIYWQVLQCDGALMSLTRYLTTRQEGFILLLDIGPAYWHRHSGSWALKQLGLAHTRILLIWKLISSDKSEQLLPYRVLGLWIISSLQLATKRVDVHSGGTPGARCLVAGDGEDRGRTSGLAVEGGGVPAPGNRYHITSTNQYHADMEHMFDDVRSGDYNTWGRNPLLCPHRHRRCL